MNEIEAKVTEFKHIHTTVSGNVRGDASLAMSGTPVMNGPRTSFYATSDSYTGNYHMLAIAPCQSQPFTGYTVLSTATPFPTYIADYTTYSGFRLPDDTPAFTARLSQDAYLFPGSRIFFDDVVSNYGGYYDAEHGFFECPDDAIYSFTITNHFPIFSTSQWSSVQLVMNGNARFNGPQTYRATNGYDSGSASVTALLQCETGRNIYIEAKDAYTFAYSVYGADLTSFSGLRLCTDCSSNFVAFSAILMQNVTVNDVEIAFGNVLVNSGNAYEPFSGRFTCPDGRYYMFAWSQTHALGNTNLDLYVNGDMRQPSYASAAPSGTDSTGTSGTSSQSIILRCSPQDIITLRASGLTATYPLLAHYTFFSAYLLPNQ